MNDDDITLKFTGDLAKQIKQLQKELECDDPSELVRKALALLMLSKGRQVKLENPRRETVIIDDFKDLDPIKD